MVVRAVVAEDERSARGEIVYLLKRCGVDVVGEAANGLEAVRLVRRLRPDVVFLDVQMPGKSGVDAAVDISSLDPRPHIVFLTAYSEFAVDAFDVGAVDYLLKPVEEGRLREALSRVEERMSAVFDRDLRVSIKRGSRVFLVSPSEIYFLEAEGGVVFAVTDAGRGAVQYRSLDAAEAELSGWRFFRCHRSFLVNLGAVSEVIPQEGGLLKLRFKGDGVPEVPVSRIRAKLLRRIMGL